MSVNTSNSTTWQKQIFENALFDPAIGVKFVPKDEDNRDIIEHYPEIVEELSKLSSIRVEFNHETRSFTLYHQAQEIEGIISAAGLTGLLGTKHTDPNINSLEVSSFQDIKNQLDYVISGTSNEQAGEAQEKLLLEATQFYQERTGRTRIVAIDDDGAFTSENILSRLLETYDGVCLGEAHSDIAPKKFIIENVKKLVDLGVKTFYLEHIFYDTVAGAAYAQNLDEPLPAHCANHLQSFGSGFMATNRNPQKYTYNYVTMVETLRKNGVRVVPIDTTTSYACGYSRAAGSEGEQRQLGMNFVATKVIEHEQNLHGGKFLALVGNTHLAKNLQGSTPGIAELLCCPSVNIASCYKTEQPGVSLNVSNFAKTISFMTADIRV